MANPTLQVDIGARIEQFQSAMRTVQTRLKDVSNQISSVGKTMSVALTAPITAFGVSSVAAFDTQAQAESRLRAALQANGREVDSLFSKYTTFASQLQQVSTTGDEATLAMLGTAESMGLTGDSAIRAVRNALAMEAAFGVSAQSAIRMTSALEQGDAQLLTRYIPSLRQTEDQAERAAIAQDILGKAFGQVTVQAQTGLGPLTQAKNAFGDLQEQMGAIIAEAINPFLQRAKVLFETLQQQPDEVKKKFVMMAGVIAGIGPTLIIFAGVVRGLATSFALLSSPVFLIAAGLIALGLLIDYLIQNVDAMKERFVLAFETMKVAMLNSLSNMALGIGNFVNTLTVGLGAAFVGLGYQLQSTVKGMEGPTTSFQSLSEYASGLKDRVSGLADSLKQAVMEALGFVDVTQKMQGPVMPALEETKLQEALEKLTEINAEVTEGINPAKMYVSTLVDGFAQAVINGERLFDALKNIGRQLASKALSRALQVLLMGGFGAGAGFFGAGGGLLGSILPRIFGGGAAAPVMGAAPAMRGMALTGEFTINGQDLRLALDRANQFATR